MTDVQLQILRTVPDTEINEMLVRLGMLKVDFPTENASAAAQVEVNTDPCPIIEAQGKTPNTIRVKVISPGQGSSGYYSTEVVKRDMPRLIQPGLQMFWDHPAKGQPRQAGQRSLDKLAGQFVSAGEWEDNAAHGPGVYADVKPLNGYASRIKELAQYNAFGVSILGDGLARDGQVAGRTTKIFEQMLNINSVDFVTAAGRGGKVVELFEAAITPEPEPIKEDKKVGLIQVEEADYNGLKTRLSTMEETLKKIPTIEADLTAARTENMTLRADRMVTAKLDASGMKKSARAKAATEMLSAVPMKEGSIDETAFNALIDAKVTEWVALVGKEPVASSFSGITNLGESAVPGTTVVNLAESAKRGTAALSRLVPGYKAAS